MSDLTPDFTHPRQAAAADPDKPAFIIAGPGRLTYRELAERSDRTARLFRSLGIVRGDAIAIFLENRLELPVLCWAAKNSGLHYVCISSQLNAPDFRYVVENSEARLVITSAALAATAAEAPEGVILLTVDDEAPGFLSYQSLLAEQPAQPLSDETRGASMLYSSGTTGRPKGVRQKLTDLPPADPPARHRMLIGAFGFGADTVFINPGPLYHAAPLRMMMAVLRMGGTVVAFERFDPEAVLGAIEQYGGTHGLFVPTMFARLLRLPQDVRERHDLGSLQRAIHSAAPCPLHVKRAMIDWWGPVIEEIYGGTEGMGHTIISAEEWLAHPGSVGRPAPGCELEIRSEDGHKLDAGEDGLIYFRNASRFSYFKEEAKTAAAVAPDGFSTLGDIGHVDDEGYLYLTDRKAHMIISGGVNIYPQEAEAVLAAHPAIADVAVIGVPDEDFGEQVKAIVEPLAMPEDPDALAADIIDYCRARLTALKCPRSVDFVEALPRTDAGKLAKHELRKAYWRGRESLIV